MYARRLLKLADYLRTVPEKRFDMSVWATNDFCGAESRPEPEHNECGTSACAMGWATTMPEFNKVGLHMYRYQNYFGNERTGIKFKESNGFGAAAKFFNITYAESEFLFAPDHSDKTPKRMAGRIKRFVTRKQKAKA